MSFFGSNGILTISIKQKQNSPHMRNKKTLLAEYGHGKIILPNLINGKVCVIDDDGYTLHKCCKYATIEDGFSPENYVILHGWSDTLAYSSEKDREKWQVNKAYNEYIQNKIVEEPVYKPGQKIHFKNKEGIYEIVSINNGVVTVKCNKWQYDEIKTRLFLVKDIKCLAGGLNRK